MSPSRTVRELLRYSVFNHYRGNVLNEPLPSIGHIHHNISDWSVNKKSHYGQLVREFHVFLYATGIKKAIEI
jgi:hypothetical protein